MPRPNRKPPTSHSNFVTAWLRPDQDPKFVSFTCTLLSEVPGVRPAIGRSFGEAVFLHHNDPETCRKKLEHLGFPATAAALDRRPRSRTTRLGNFGEILAGGAGGRAGPGGWTGLRG
jgi:hypothetical protein